MANEDDRDTRSRQPEATSLQKLADSALLKLVTAFVTMFMVPLVWRIADAMTEMRTNAAIIEIRVKTMENRVPQREAQLGELHDFQVNGTTAIADLKTRMTQLEQTCKRIDGR